MKTHRRLVLAIATTLGIGLMASGGAFGHGWGHGWGHGYGYGGYGYGAQGYQPPATWVRPDQPAGYRHRYRHFQGDTAPGPRAGDWEQRGEKTGAPHYGRRLHARAGVCPRVEGEAPRPRYGARLGPRQGTLPPPQPGECPNAQERQADDTET